MRGLKKIVLSREEKTEGTGVKFRSCLGRRPDRWRPHSPTAEHFPSPHPLLEWRPIMYSALTPLLPSPSLPFLSSSFLSESAVNTFLPHFHSIHSLFRPTNGLDWLPYPPSFSQRRFALALALSYQLPTGFPQPPAFSSRIESRPDMEPSWDGSEQG